MRILLDTHAVLWAFSGDSRFSSTAREAFLNAENDLFLSVASIWEISIKLSLGKLKLRDGWLAHFESELRANTIRLLSIKPSHCEVVASLPFHHRDPFDRMLVAQASVEEMFVLSGDEQLSKYSVKQVW